MRKLLMLAHERGGAATVAVKIRLGHQGVDLGAAGFERGNVWQCWHGWL
jgi:hypothetical protein